MLSTLTAREKEVLLLAAEGRPDKEIAEKLGVSRGTITTHWSRMRERTGAANRAQVIALELSRIYREAETERSRTSFLYQSLIDSLQDFAVFLMDLDRTITTWNPGVKQILGYEAEEWIGQTGDILFTPEDQAAGVPDLEMKHAREDGKALDDRWHQRSDKSLFWASGVMVGVRDEAGKLLCYSKILRDLTRLKELEAQVEALSKNAG